MAKLHSLLLLESVEGLGIVGDVVKVRAGHARNFLLPRGYATEPSDELIEQLADKRRQAEAERAALRKTQQEAIEKLESFSLTIERSHNDQGQLYGSVSQHDIAELLQEQGYPVAERHVRINQAIKALGNFDVPVKFAPDLETEFNITVVSDRPEEYYADQEDEQPESEEAPAEDAANQPNEHADAETQPAASEA